MKVVLKADRSSAMEMALDLININVRVNNYPHASIVFKNGRMESSEGIKDVDNMDIENIKSVGYTTSAGNSCFVNLEENVITMEGRRHGLLTHFLYNNNNLRDMEVLEYSSTEPTWKWYECKDDYIAKDAMDFGGVRNILKMTLPRSMAVGVPRTLYVEIHRQHNTGCI